MGTLCQGTIVFRKHAKSYHIFIIDAEDLGDVQTVLNEHLAFPVDENMVMGLLLQMQEAKGMSKLSFSNT